MKSSIAYRHVVLTIPKRFKKCLDTLKLERDVGIGEYADITEGSSHSPTHCGTLPFVVGDTQKEAAVFAGDLLCGSGII